MITQCTRCGGARSYDDVKGLVVCICEPFKSARKAIIEGMKRAAEAKKPKIAWEVTPADRRFLKALCISADK